MHSTHQGLTLREHQRHRLQASPWSLVQPHMVLGMKSSQRGRSRDPRIRRSDQIPPSASVKTETGYNQPQRCLRASGIDYLGLFELRSSSNSCRKAPQSEDSCGVQPSGGRLVWQNVFSPSSWQRQKCTLRRKLARTRFHPMPPRRTRGYW